MKELSIEEKAYNYGAYTELINRLKDVKEAIKKQNYGIAMDILCRPYPEYQITTSTEWNEKDEKYLNDAIDACKAQYGNMSYTADWLKYLKYRVQLQTIWEPSDESMLNAVANSLDRWRVERVWHTTIEEVVARLKSFKYRCTWKPSDEQMETLKLSTYCPSERMSKVLFELYEDLKKLRKEYEYNK